MTEADRPDTNNISSEPYVSLAKDGDQDDDDDNAPTRTNDIGDKEPVVYDNNNDTASSPLLSNNDTGNRNLNSNDHSINIDLNNRETRLTIWCITYFIFALAEFVGNTILANGSIGQLKTAYQIWAASDFFLFLGSMILFIECNPIYILNDIDISSDTNRHKICRYIACFLFIFGGILRWFGLGTHNDIMCDTNFCNSLHFAQDYMATYFSIYIGLDCIDIFKLIPIDNERCFRMLMYCILLIIDTIVVVSVLDQVRTDYYGGDANNNSEFGFFLVLFMLIAIIIISILALLQKYDGLVSGDKLRKYLHFALVVTLCLGLALVYYSFFLLYQTFLYIVASLMVIFDLMCMV